MTRGICSRLDHVHTRVRQVTPHVAPVCANEVGLSTNSKNCDHTICHESPNITTSPRNGAHLQLLLFVFGAFVSPRQCGHHTLRARCDGVTVCVCVCVVTPVRDDWFLSLTPPLLCCRSERSNESHTHAHTRTHNARTHHVRCRRLLDLVGHFALSLHFRFLLNCDRTVPTDTRAHTVCVCESHVRTHTTPHMVERPCVRRNTSNARLPSPAQFCGQSHRHQRHLHTNLQDC
jgi:hypothetical protein